MPRGIHRNFDAAAPSLAREQRREEHHVGGRPGVGDRDQPLRDEDPRGDRGEAEGGAARQQQRPAPEGGEHPEEVPHRRADPAAGSGRAGADLMPSPTPWRPSSTRRAPFVNGSDRLGDDLSRGLRSAGGRPAHRPARSRGESPDRAGTSDACLRRRAIRSRESTSVFQATRSARLALRLAARDRRAGERAGLAADRGDHATPARRPWPSRMRRCTPSTGSSSAAVAIPTQSSASSAIGSAKARSTAFRAKIEGISSQSSAKSRP